LAFRAPKSLRNVEQPRVQSGNRGERARVDAAGVATWARQQNFILAEFIGEFLDVKLAGHRALSAGSRSRVHPVLSRPSYCMSCYISNGLRSKDVGAVTLAFLEFAASVDPR
jgi:hypothetical protein